MFLINKFKKKKEVKSKLVFIINEKLFFVLYYSVSYNLNTIYYYKHYLFYEFIIRTLLCIYMTLTDYEILTLKQIIITYQNLR
jgi:hypothetical protein